VEKLDDPRKQAIRDFLEEVKQTIAGTGRDYQRWLLVNRRENIECMAELGFNYSDIRDAILELSVADYCEGPLRDRDAPGDMWVFGKVMGHEEIYIKLKLASFGRVKKLRIVSYHPARESLCYPYTPKKKSEEE
jgi:hypothetical protein